MTTSETIAIGELSRLNADFGHEGTEEIIEEVRQRLHSVMRRRDQLMHYSGNRFAILLTGCPANQIEVGVYRPSQVGSELAKSGGAIVADRRAGRSRVVSHQTDEAIHHLGGGPESEGANLFWVGNYLPQSM